MSIPIIEICSQTNRVEIVGRYFGLGPNQEDHRFQVPLLRSIEEIGPKSESITRIEDLNIVTLIPVPCYDNWGRTWTGYKLEGAPDDVWSFPKFSRMNY